MASILLAEEETIILSTIYDYVAQYPIIKDECIEYFDPKYINIKVDKVYVYEHSIIVDIEYITMNDKNIISFELNRINNAIYFGCDTDPQFINDIMYLPGVVNFKFIETYKSKDISTFAYQIRNSYRLGIKSGTDIFYKFLYIHSDKFSDTNGSPMFNDDVMFSSEESAIRFLENGSICIIENSQENNYHKSVGLLPLYILEYLMQGYYLDAIQIQRDLKELRRQSDENISRWISISA